MELSKNEKLKQLEKYGRDILKKYPESRVVYQKGLFLAPAFCIFCHIRIEVDGVCEGVPEGRWFCPKCGGVEDLEAQSSGWLYLQDMACRRRFQNYLPAKQASHDFLASALAEYRQCFPLDEAEVDWVYRYDKRGNVKSIPLLF